MEGGLVMGRGSECVVRSWMRGDGMESGGVELAGRNTLLLFVPGFDL